MNIRLPGIGPEAFPSLSGEISDAPSGCLPGTPMAMKRALQVGQIAGRYPLSTSALNAMRRRLGTPANAIHPDYDPPSSLF